MTTAPQRVPRQAALSLRHGWLTARALLTPPAIDSKAGTTGVPADTTVCDDFVCTSSPAVGVSITSIAKQVDGPVRDAATGVAWAAAMVVKDGGAFAEVEGEGTGKYAPVSELLEGAKGEVLSMDMADNKTLLLRWRLRAGSAAGEIDADVLWKVEFNLISGRAIKLEVEYDTARTSPPAAAVFALRRALVALSLRGKGEAGKAGDSSDVDISQVGSDPGRFFQQQSQEDQFQKEAVDFALALAVLYALVTGLKAVL